MFDRLWWVIPPVYNILFTATFFNEIDIFGNHYQQNLTANRQ